MKNNMLKKSLTQLKNKSMCLLRQNIIVKIEQKFLRILDMYMIGSMYIKN